MPFYESVFELPDYHFMVVIFCYQCCHFGGDFMKNNNDENRDRYEREENVMPIIIFVLIFAVLSCFCVMGIAYFVQNFF